MRLLGDPIIEVIATGLGLLSACMLTYGTAGGGPTAQVAPIALGLAALGLGVLGAKDAVRVVARHRAWKSAVERGRGAYTGKDNP